ncbi:MAG TPA: hypothetical protein VNJ11_17370 [Bryobacteraceae bacterium]|nr:hypothetical protein [Bryobacteraceae bacterium]
MAEKPRGRGTRGKAEPGSEGESPPTIQSREELAAVAAKIVARLNRDPELAKAMFLNPAAAIQETGYKLAPEVFGHILRAVRHSKATAARRAELEARLEKELGEPPRPLDSDWLKRILFERLRIGPLDTSGREPVYREAISGALRERLEKFRPRVRRISVKTPKPLHGVAIQTELTHRWPGRFDLDAKLEDLPRAAAPPEQVDLNTLYFYKDSHPLVRELIELAVIQRSSFPLHTPESYRKVRSGERPSPLRTWITGVRFGR